ncbi:DUF1565 domain-containing protein [Moorena producens]|uniref:DUF1565 domain-containing protein n=1 Tax=Moorena producens TaxID=1155739 RepID=UPI003C738E2B
MLNRVQTQKTLVSPLVIPSKTITYALQQARPLATIHLAPGQYTVEQGETFPLKLKTWHDSPGKTSPLEVKEWS